MSGWREAIREITGEQSEPMLKKVSPSEAFSTMDRDMGASQPNPTPQVPAAPTLEQLAGHDVDNNIHREIRVFNNGDGWMWAYYNDPLPPYSPMSKFADKRAAIRSAKRFIESVSKSTVFYLHGSGVDAHWERV